MAHTINMENIDGTFRNTPKVPSWIGKILGLIIIFVFIFIFIIAFCLVTIPAGHVGVQYSWFGGVQDSEFGEGWHLKPPWISVTKYNVRTIQKTEPMHALSNEGLSVNMDATILYHIVPDKANEIHKGIDPPYEETIVMTQFRSVIREVVAGYEAIDIYTEKRPLLEQKVLDETSRRLEEKDIIVESILFRNVELPQHLIAGIEEKKRAEQDALRMKYILEKEELEADRKRVEAKGIADANDIIAGSLTTNYLTWYWINNLDKHNSVMYVPIGEMGMPMFKNIDEVSTGVANTAEITNNTGN